MNRPRISLIFISLICAILALGVLGHTQSASQPPKSQQEHSMSRQAIGTFEVKVTPQTSDDKSADPNLGRMSLVKQIHGDLEATSTGQMLTAGTNVKGSAGYVAIERVTGTLNGLKGSFILQHSGTMSHGALQLHISVVPDSGTDQLTGISGTFNIIIADGEHSYDFAYELPAAK
jgi:hypothetical protein